MSTEPVTTIPALTLWQPWACLIEIGVKRYETRSKRAPWHMVGERIAIHAAARPVVTDLPQNVIDDITEAFGRCGWNYDLPRGVIVCTARLKRTAQVNSVTETHALVGYHDEPIELDPFGDYSPGRWIWELEDVRPVIPHLPAKGRQQWGWPWTPPEGLKP